MRLKASTAVLLICILTTSALSSVFAGTLTLVADQPDAGWKIELDNEERDFYQGVTFYLDEGVHRLRAYVPGYQRIDRPVHISEGEELRVELELEQQGAVSFSPDLRERALRHTGELVVTSAEGSAPFSLDGEQSQTPKAFEVGTGEHQLRFGDASHQVSVQPDRVHYVQIDLGDGVLRQFALTQEQAERLEARHQSLQEVFREGYAEYGPRWYESMWAVVAAIAVLLMLILLFVVRLSLGGRVRAAKRHRSVLERRGRKARNLKSQAKRNKLKKDLRRNKKQIEELQTYIRNQIAQLEKRQIERQDQKQRKQVLRRLKRLKKLQKKLAS
ncbi:MAG: hypothetical protein ACQEQU_05670 [Spirochaetota bacterium]